MSMMRRCGKLWTGREGRGRAVFALAVFLVVAGGAGVASGAVQNIFVGMDTIADVQVGGENIDLMMYQGVVLWERAAPAPVEPDPSAPTTYGAMQNMTNAQCKTTRGTAYDARNGQTYYVQRIGNLCWMESNLRYAGDGSYEPGWGYPDDRYATTASNTTANTNDDARPLTIRASGTASYTVAEFMDPNGSTLYTDTSPNGGFYGYLYNWCTTMGGQPNACNNTSTTGIVTTQSICPAGWRLPTGNVGGEYQGLNNAMNGGAANTDAGLRNNFLAVYSGNYVSGLGYQGSDGSYWSSTVVNASVAYYMSFNSGVAYPSALNYNKYYGRAVRCVL